MNPKMKWQIQDKGNKKKAVRSLWQRQWRSGTTWSQKYTDWKATQIIIIKIANSQISLLDKLTLMLAYWKKLTPILACGEANSDVSQLKRLAQMVDCLKS